MVYNKLDDGSFLVSSKSKPNLTWHVSKDMDNCDCPKFKFILKGRAPCHHIEEVMAKEKSAATSTPDLATGFDKLNLKEYKTPMPTLDFIEKYGDDQLNHYLKYAELLIYKGLVRRVQ